MKLKKFKIRCSAIGQIMTNSSGKTKSEKILAMTADISDRQTKHDAIKDGLKSKSNAAEKIEALKSELEVLNALPDEPELSQTAKTYCENWIKEQLYERRKEISSKHTEKGNQTEDPAIDYCAAVLGWGLIGKNQERKSNEYMEGECDVDLPDRITDIKNSFDCFTFPLFESEIPDKGYEWQVRGYMNLWGKNFASVVFTLMDMPPDMIAKEVRWRLGEEYTKEQYEAFVSQFIYSNLPDNLRIKQFHFEHDQSKVEQINRRVIQCRQYIQTLIEKTFT